MKLARLIAAPSVVVLCSFLGCSDPPSPPAQAAVALTVSGTSAGQCPVPGNPMTIPPDPAGMPSAVSSALLCDLTDANCKPDAYVTVQGDNNATVLCSVTSSGDGFDFSVSIGSNKLTFSASGHVTSAGGDGTMNLYEASTGSNLQVNAPPAPPCKITIAPNQGTVKSGAIWAHFECDSLSDPQDVKPAICTSTGEFIFENCDN